MNITVSSITSKYLSSKAFLDRKSKSNLELPLLSLEKIDLEPEPNGLNQRHSMNPSDSTKSKREEFKFCSFVEPNVAPVSTRVTIERMNAFQVHCNDSSQKVSYDQSSNSTCARNLDMLSVTTAPNIKHKTHTTRSYHNNQVSNSKENMELQSSNLNLMTPSSDTPQIFEVEALRRVRIVSLYDYESEVDLEEFIDGYTDERSSDRNFGHFVTRYMERLSKIG